MAVEEYKYRPLSNFEFTRNNHEDMTQNVDRVVEAASVAVMPIRPVIVSACDISKVCLLQTFERDWRDAWPPSLHGGLTPEEEVFRSTFYVCSIATSNVSSIDARQKSAIAPSRFSTRALRIAYFVQTPNTFDMPRILRPDLIGPLFSLGLGREGALSKKTIKLTFLLTSNSERSFLPFAP